MRYVDPHNNDRIGNPELLKRWLPVDYYMGGSDHTTGHLLYARFITKVLSDLGDVPFDEPFRHLFHQGMIMGEDGRKMGKRYDNGVRPEDVADKYGSDALRLAEMFFGPLEQSKPWNTQTVAGTKKIIDKIYSIFKTAESSTIPSPKELSDIDTLVSITDHIDKGRFNVAVSDFMSYIKNLDKQKPVNKQVTEKFLKLLAPFAPFITEELWEVIGNKYSIHKEEWPQATLQINEGMGAIVPIPITINGKKITTFPIPNTPYTMDELISLLAASPEVKNRLDGRSIIDVKYIPGKILNFITE